MKKNFLRLIGLVIAFSFLSGCDKGDMKVKKLNHGDGIWTIVSIHYEFYDAAGHAVISDSTISNPGEFVFFKTTTLDALWDYHLVVANMKNANGTNSAYRGEVFFDTDRADFEKTVAGDAFPFLGLWSVNNSSRHKQEWSSFGLRGDGTLGSKTTINLKKK